MKSLLTNSLPIKKIIFINIQKWFFGKGKKSYPLSPRRTLRERPQAKSRTITKGKGGEGESKYDFFPFPKKPFLDGKQMREKR